MDFAYLVNRARALVAPDGGRAILGLTGSPGAGKTTLAEELARALTPTPPAGFAPGNWVARLPMDGFHLADVELDRLGRRDGKGAPDTFDADGYTAMLRRLTEDGDDVVYAPAFDREIEQPVAGSIPIARATRLVITEGNYLLVDDSRWQPVTKYLSEIWFCDLAEDERLHRLITRHERFGKSRQAAVDWATGTDQRNAELVAATRPRADLVVPAAVLRSIGVPPEPPCQRRTSGG